MWGYSVEGCGDLPREIISHLSVEVVFAVVIGWHQQVGIRGCPTFQVENEVLHDLGPCIYVINASARRGTEISLVIVRYPSRSAETQLQLFYLVSE